MEAECVPSVPQLYEQFYGPAIFRPLAQALIAHAPPPPGGRVLDLACGTGLVARHVARELGADGQVLAVDINPGMLAVARSQPAPDGAPIEWRQADASTADLPTGHFDMAYCQQGLQFFPDRAAALRRVHAALRPDGRLAIATWQGLDKQPLLSEFMEVELRHLAPLGITPADLTAPFSLGDTTALRELLADCGFAGISTEPFVLDVSFAEPETFARKMETAYGAVIPAFVEDAAAFAVFLDAVERETRGIVQRYTVDGRVRFLMPANFTVAIRS